MNGHESSNESRLSVTLIARISPALPGSNCGHPFNKPLKLLVTPLGGARYGPCKLLISASKPAVP